MPISKHRKKHAHHQYHPKAQPKAGHAGAASAHSGRSLVRKSAVTMMVVLLAVLGAGIGFFSAGADIIWLSAGALLGAIAGFFIGQGIDRMAAKTK